MSSLSISKAWDESKAIGARDGRLIAAVALALVLLPQAIYGVIVPPPAMSGEEAPSWATGLSLIVAVIGVVGQIAIIKLALGPATSVGESILHGFKRSFFPGSYKEKRGYVRTVIDYYDRVTAQHGLPQIRRGAVS